MKDTCKAASSFRSLKWRLSQDQCLVCQGYLTSCHIVEACDWVAMDNSIRPYADRTEVHNRITMVELYIDGLLTKGNSELLGVSDTGCTGPGRCGGMMSVGISRVNFAQGERGTRPEA